MKDTISRRQCVAAAFVAVLSPLIRRFPRALVRTAGRTAWLSVPMTLLLLAAVFALLGLLYRRREPGAAFSDILADVWGRAPGGVLTTAYALWFLFYAGFLLRSGALRLISTVYHGADADVFILAAAALCLPAVLGSVRAIARAAMLIRPLMTALFVLITVLTFQDLDLSLLLPVRFSDLPANGMAALETVNVIAAAGCLVFLSDRVEGRFVLRDYLGWTLALLAVIALMTVCCLGLFGAALTANMSFPFFMLARDVTVLGAIERIEPLVIAMWVLSDFVMISLLLRAAGEALRRTFGLVSREEALADVPALCMRRGRWLLPLGLAAAVAAALVMARSKAAFDVLSETLVPLLNAVFAFGIPALTLLLAALRRRM